MHFLVLSGPELTRELITKLLTSHPLNGGVIFCGEVLLYLPSPASILYSWGRLGSGRSAAQGNCHALTHENKSCSAGLVKNICVGEDRVQDQRVNAWPDPAQLS